MKRLIKILILFFVISSILKFGGLELFKPSTVRAFGRLTVDFHVPPGSPLFVVNNMVPGDVVQKSVDAVNGWEVPRMAVVRGVRKGGVGSNPKFETVLEIVIKEGNSILYGPRKLSEFFSDSQGEIGVQLNFIAPLGQKTYTFEVTFPESSENEFQEKSVIFDLVFFVITPDYVALNEVYYGADSDEEWVELYNPLDYPVSLDNWSLTDNSGNKAVMPTDIIIKAGGYAILSKDASLWDSWDEGKDALKIELGEIIGDGLDINGDRLILRDATGREMDRISWGTDLTGFNPPVFNPPVASGHSTERVVPGFDTGSVSDWLDQSTPTPGN